MANQRKTFFGRTWLHLMGMGLAMMLVFTPAVSFAQQLKVAYVDLQRALNEVEEGKKAKERLKKDFDKRQKQFNDKRDAVAKMKDDLEKGADMLSEDARRKRAMEFQQKLVELQQLGMSLQQELAAEEQKATKKIFDKMGGIIKDIAKEKGYSLVFERNEAAILHGDPALDLTDELIKRYNK